MDVRIDYLVASLEAEARRRGITKKALAVMAGVHPNSLRAFNTDSIRSDDKPWSPTLAVLRKVENALFPPVKSPTRRQRSQPTDNTTHANGEAAI